MSKKKTEIQLTQECLNEIGSEMAGAMKKTKVEAWNGALVACTEHIKNEAKGSEMVTVQSVVECLQSFMVGEDDEIA